MSKRIWIITLYPEYFGPFKTCGIIGQLLSGKRGIEIDLGLIDLRDYADNNYKSVDDYPYGGGPGMVLRADCLKKALLEGVVEAGNYGENYRSKIKIISTAPRGVLWSHEICKSFAQDNYSHESKDLVFICGRYEGLDERFLNLYVDESYCLGDYILSGGELAVMNMLDSSFRFIPGVLGNNHSVEEESFEDGLLEHTHYTRPREFDGVQVPEILLSGHHAKITEYRKKIQYEQTAKLRPDLLP